MSIIYDDIIKKASIEIKNKFGISLSEKEIKDIYKKYLHTINRYLSVGTKNKINTFAQRIVYEGIGFIILEVSRFRRALEKDRAENILLDEVSVAAYNIRMKGWNFLNWNEEEGYIFVNIKEGIRYPLKRDTFYGLKGAYIYFSEICDSPLIRMGLDVITLRDIKKAEVRIGEIIVCDTNRKVIKEFDTLEEAANTTYFSSNYIYKVLLNNWDNPTTPKRIRNEYWFLKKNYDSDIKFRLTTVNVINKDIVDLIDAKTNEIVIKSIGTLSDVAEYINSLNGSWEKVKTNCLNSAYRKNLTRYGFRFKKSV